MRKMNKFIIIIILIFCLIFLLSLEKGLGAQELKKDYLVNNNWGPEYKIGITIEFKKDNSFEAFEDYGMDFREVKGIYEIKNKKLALYDDAGKVFLSGGELVYDENNVKYKYYLLFNEDKIVYNLNTKTKPGSEVYIDGYMSVTIDSKEAKLTYNMKFREKPDLNGKIINYYRINPESDDLMEEELKFVPKDTTIYVIARTKDKYKVDKWNNYWYYVEVPDVYGFSRTKGWMFAEFIEFTK